MLIPERDKVVVWVSFAVMFLAGGLYGPSPSAQEREAFASKGTLELGQMVGLSISDLGLKLFVSENETRWNGIESTGNDTSGAGQALNLIAIGPSANFILGHVVSLDMKVGYGLFSLGAGAPRAANEGLIFESVPQWRWFSSVTLSSYHQVKGFHLRGRIGFRQLLSEDVVGLNGPHWAGVSTPGYPNQQHIDARFGLAFGRIEPFVGGLYAYESASIPTGFEREWESRKLDNGASLGVRGGLQFAIGETLRGGIVGSRKLGDIGRVTDTLEGSLRIKF